jgi:catechol 2,3-dioxygenase-like lactoylglutathione lyase family enzyme
MMTNFIGKQFDQVAFVVDDLDRAVDKFTKIYGIQSWNVWSGLAHGQINKVYRGKPGNYEFSCAYGFVGDLMVELCHHDGGESVYKDWLDSNGPSLHHLGFRLETKQELEEAAASFERQGAPLAMGGEIEGLGIWAYYDTVDQLGCFTELYWSAPAVLEIFARMKAGEQVALR